MRLPERATAWALCGSTSALLLLGALAFQFVLGYRPCPMCLQERWLHVLVLTCAFTGFIPSVRRRAGTWHDLACICLLYVAAGAGFHHAAVEAGWVAASCGMDDYSAAATTRDILASLPDLPAPSCDNVSWTFMGMSMALWNGLLSALAAGMSIFVVTRKQR